MNAFGGPRLYPMQRSSKTKLDMLALSDGSVLYGRVRGGERGKGCTRDTITLMFELLPVEAQKNKKEHT